MQCKIISIDHIDTDMSLFFRHQTDDDFHEKFWPKGVPSEKTVTVVGMEKGNYTENWGEFRVI